MTSQKPEFAMGKIEFICLLAMMFATIAFSIDAMLAALPEIGAELSPDDPSRGPLVLTAFILGMGVGTFIMGPLSDSFGRRNVVFAGSILYLISATVACQAQTIEVMLVARVVQGFGAAGPRVVSLAIVRDLFSGREMAKIMSIVMLIFTLVPAFAPAMGAAIMLFSGWRGIFVAFIVFICISMLWMGFRLPETLAYEDRRPFRPAKMFGAAGEMFAHPTVRLAIVVQTLAMAMLFATLLLIQPIYAEVFGKGETFTVWVGGIALIAGSASILNALLVGRYGMRRLVTVALGIQVFLSAAMYLLSFSEIGNAYGFALFLIWQTCLFCQAGLTIGNLNAIAMEPLGHIAGMAASVIGGVSTMAAAVIASPIALMFDGTVRPLMITIFLMATFGFVLMRKMKFFETAEVPLSGSNLSP